MLLKPDKIPDEWRDVLLDIPGYDSIATAGDCVFNEKLAVRALEFFPKCLRHVEGVLAGKPFELEHWQKAVIANLFGWQRKHRKHGWIRRYREVLIYVSRKNGKMLALDTPIPTPSGWTTMGEIGVGDVVFDENGKPTRVVGLSEIDLAPESYRITFSNGETIRACGDHQWVTETAGSIRAKTTSEICETQRQGHSIRMPDGGTVQITNVERINSTPMRCIEVDSPSHQYLCGRTMIPTHNSPLASGIALFMFFCDPTPGKQCYLAAGDREQASIIFRHAKGMIQQEPLLEKRCKIYGGTGSVYQSRSIVREEEGSFMRVVSADADTKHGGNTHFAVIDELHVQPKRDLVDVFSTSMASENIPEPIIAYLTTADYNRVSICNEKYEYACKVRDGISDDSAFLPVIHEALIDEDWTDPMVWAKANPNLGVSVSLEYLERECKKAKETPAYENTFRRLHLNQRTQQDVRAIAMDKWDACGAGVDPVQWREETLVKMKRQRCAGGLDLGSVSDLTALALLFGSYESGFDVLPFFWCPADNAAVRSRRDGVDYVQWANAGFITLTPGNETDYQQVRREINSLADQYGIYQLGADRLFQGAQLCQDLLGDGMDVVAMGQGYQTMAAPTRAFLELVAGGRLRHGNNPVLKWMAGNAATEDQVGNGEVLKFSKKKSTEKIDGIVAICEAIAIAMESEDDSVYQTREPIFIGGNFEDEDDDF